MNEPPRGKQFLPLPVAQQRPTSQAVRHCLRLLGMVHELHKVGYQRLRIDTGMAPTGLSWRCIISTAKMREGLEPARYSSASGTEYFGWTDAHQDTARQLALKFVDRFPELCASAVGLDLSYAGWLTWILGQAEGGKLPVLFADYPIKVDPLDVPPPPPVE